MGGTSDVCIPKPLEFRSGTKKKRKVAVCIQPISV